MPQFSPFTISTHQKLVTFDRPAVMGILNVTPDSFYDGGQYIADDDAISHARELLNAGADIIDVGVVSSRPGSFLANPEDEAARLSHIVKKLRQNLPADTLISVDTCFSLPARKAIEAGADIINDISGGQFDKQMFATVADLQVPYILMHTRGTPDTMQSPENTHYSDIIHDLALYFSEKLDQLYRLGVKDVWIDPGFGFAKTLDQNHELLERLGELVSLFPQQPLLTALSNKSMISKRIDDSELGTIVLDALALRCGSRILRVHDPLPARKTIQLLFPKCDNNS